MPRRTLIFAIAALAFLESGAWLAAAILHQPELASQAQAAAGKPRRHQHRSKPVDNLAAVLNLKPGDKMPDFRLPVRNTDGTAGTFHLHAQRGHPVVLFFYPKADTPG